jgi:hypothetical protein
MGAGIRQLKYLSLKGLTSRQPLRSTPAAIDLQNVCFPRKADLHIP